MYNPRPRTFLRLATGLMAVASLAACSSTGSNATIGGFAGGQAGGNRASQSIAAAMGAGLIGSAGGVRLDERDMRRALEAEYRALEYTSAGERVAWQGDAAIAGEVIAYQPYRVGSQDCRQYVHNVQVSGQTRSMRGTACRNGDGSWTPLV
jgi:surface antigen